jgi:dihydropteroate synthase
VPMKHNARVLAIYSDAEIADEMRGVGADSAAIERALPKARQHLVRLEGVSAPYVRILADCFLSSGADVVCHDPANAKTSGTDVILIGTLQQYSQAIEALKAQQNAGVELAIEIASAVEKFDSFPTPLPDEVITTQRVRAVFQEMSRRTLVMGILNVTPDSFSDGGRYSNSDMATERALQMIGEGADVIDIGGESTRPGSEPVSEQEEKDRILPVIKNLRAKSDIPISVDTWKAEVARAALGEGADIVNDISALSFDPKMRALVAEKQCAAILMHIKGTPRDMQSNPTYENVLSEVIRELRERVNEAVEQGIDERLLMIDPGFGFGKTPEHNLLILRRLREFKSLGRPVLIGTSRKSTIGKTLGGLPANERLEGTAATVTISVMNGANIVRVHDVKEMARVVKMTEATLAAGIAGDSLNHS